MSMPTRGSTPNALPNIDDGLPPEWLLRGAPSESQREFLDTMSSLGRAFVAGDGRDGAVLKYADNETLRALFSEPLPQEGASLQNLIGVVRDKVVAHSVDQHATRYLAFPDIGASLVGIGADILNSYLNQNLIAVDRSAPSATFVEAQVILWLRELIGFPTHTLADLPNLSALGGMWTPGGNLSNTIAMLLALHSRHPELRKDGMVGLSRRPLIVQSREIAHFSYANAAIALGLGERGILWAPSTPQHTTDPEGLARAIDEAPADGEPFVVVAVSGNCRTGNLDNLRRIREVCDERGLWMHVDACHGGSLLFSERLRASFLAGLELADSVSLDPHKGMFITYPSSYLIVREASRLAAFSRYPERVVDPTCFDLGLITPLLGSRGFQSLKLWLLIKHLGVSGLGCAIEARHAVNAALTTLLESTGLFVLLNEQAFYRVAFVFCPGPVLEKVRSLGATPSRRDSLRRLIDEFTARYCEGLYRSGAIVFDLATAHDLSDRLGLGVSHKLTVMGMVSGQTTITHEELEALEQALCERGHSLAEEMLRALDQETLDPSRRAASGPAGW